MALQQIRSVSDAKNVVNALRYSPSWDATQRVNARTLCTNDSWGYLCEAGYPQCIEEYANDLGLYDIGYKTLPAWHLSATEMTVALQSSSTTPELLSTSALNIRSLALLRNVITSKILPAMLATRTIFLVDPQKSEHPEKVDACITAASGLLFALCHSLKVHLDEAYTALLRSSGALEVALLCWYYTPHLPTRVTSSITLESLLSPSPSSETTQSLSRLTSTIPPQDIVGKCHQMLKDGIDPPGQMTSGHRLVELCLIQWFSDGRFKEGLGVLIVRGDLQRSVAEVVRYELVNAKRGGGSNEGGIRDRSGAVMNWELVDMAGAVLLALSNVADLPVATLIEYIERLSVLNLLSEIFVDKSLSEEAQAWSNILDLFVHCTTCVATNCHYVRTDAYITALSSALESGSLWANTLMRIQGLIKANGSNDHKKTEARKKRLRAWYALGKEAGLTAKLSLVPSASGAVAGNLIGKGMIREREDGCRWEQCERRGRVNDDIEQMLSRCSRCKTARYCSGDCQKADWPMHKGECKALEQAGG